MWALRLQSTIRTRGDSAMQWALLLAMHSPKTQACVYLIELFYLTCTRACITDTAPTQGCLSLSSKMFPSSFCKIITLPSRLQGTFPFNLFCYESNLVLNPCYRINGHFLTLVGIESSTRLVHVLEKRICITWNAEIAENVIRWESSWWCSRKVPLVFGVMGSCQSPLVCILNQPRKLDRRLSQELYALTYLYKNCWTACKMKWTQGFCRRATDNFFIAEMVRQLVRKRVKPLDCTLALQ